MSIEICTTSSRSCSRRLEPHSLANMGRYQHKMDSEDIVDKLRYVAGFFDIAGDARIEKGTRPLVSIDRPLASRPNLMRIKEMFGGLVLSSTRGWCVWKVYDDDAIRFVRFIKPHTRIKRRQLEAAEGFSMPASDIRLRRAA